MKIVKNIRYFLLCFIVLFLEMTIGKYLAIQGTVPMLSFCLSIVIAVKEENPNYIVVIGIILGAFLDILLGHGFGSYTVAFSISSLITYCFRDNIFSSKLLFLIINSIILSFLICVFYYLFHILDVGIDFGIMMTRIALPTSLYNTIICIVLYFALGTTFYKRR